MICPGTTLTTKLDIDSFIPRFLTTSRLDCRWYELHSPACRPECLEFSRSGEQVVMVMEEEIDRLGDFGQTVWRFRQNEVIPATFSVEMMGLSLCQGEIILVL